MKRILEKLSITEIPLDEKTQKVFRQELEMILTFQDAISRLESILDSYESTLTIAASKNEFIDLETARELQITAQALITLCRDDPYADHIPFTLAAIAYFLNEDDGVSDFDDLQGFDDDKLILEQVVQHFNLTESLQKRISEIKTKPQQGDKASA